MSLCLWTTPGRLAQPHRCSQWCNQRHTSVLLWQPAEMQKDVTHGTSQVPKSEVKMYSETNVIWFCLIRGVLLIKVWILDTLTSINDSMLIWLNYICTCVEKIMTSNALLNTPFSTICSPNEGPEFTAYVLPLLAWLMTVWPSSLEVFAPDFTLSFLTVGPGDVPRNHPAFHKIVWCSFLLLQMSADCWCADVPI